MVTVYISSLYRTGDYYGTSNDIVDASRCCFGVGYPSASGEI